MARRKTNEEFVEELKIINPKIVPLEEYINSRTKILCRCLVCNSEWKVKPDALLSAHGCPSCNSLKKSHDEFKHELEKLHPEIELLSEYKNCKEKVKIKHLDCGHVEYKLPTSLIGNHYRGCYKCHKRAKILPDAFNKKVYENNPHIEIIGKYKNSQTNVFVSLFKRRI